MKKLGIILTTCLLVLGLTSCGNSKSVVEPMSKAEIKESERVINEKIKGKNSQEITQLITDTQAEANFGEEYFKKTGLKFKNYSSLNMDVSVTDTYYGYTQGIKLNADLGVEFIINSNKGAYATLDLNADMSQSVKYQGQSQSATSKIELGLGAEYVKNDKTYINVNVSGMGENSKLKLYTTSLEIDELIGWSFDDTTSSLGDLLENVSTSDSSVDLEEVIGSLDTVENVKYAVKDGYLECRYTPNMTDLIDTLNETLDTAALGISMGEVSEDDISIDLVMRLDSNFMFSSLTYNVSIQVPNFGKISLKTETGLSFGNFDYKGLSNKDSYTTYQSLEDLIGGYIY